MKITDRELAVCQMHKNRYTRIEIADALKISDETVDWILNKNSYHLRKLAEMDDGCEKGVI